MCLVLRVSVCIFIIDIIRWFTQSGTNNRILSLTNNKKKNKKKKQQQTDISRLNWHTIQSFLVETTFLKEKLIELCHLLKIYIILPA